MSPLLPSSLGRASLRSASLTGHRRRLQPAIEPLEARLALAGIVNGDFAITNPADPGFGWALRGEVSVANGAGVLDEGTSEQTEFSQTFTIAPGMTTLRFTILALQLTGNGGPNPPDAFEAALLDAQTNQPLVGPPTGLSRTDAFLNIQQSGAVSYAPEITIPGVGASGSIASLTFPKVITVDVSSVPADTQVTLYFDLIGFSPTSSSVRIDDVVTPQGPAPPAVSFLLDPATDSGAVGDNLTNVNPVNLVGATDPNQVVALDVNGDGFDDGTVTADDTGQFMFSDVPLAAGANSLRVQATNAFGTTTSARTITLDQQPPSGLLVLPAAGSTATSDLGSVEVQWTDAGAAGLDPASFDSQDVTITGVTVDQAEDLGSGRVRYRYNLDGETLPTGPVQVTLVAGQVADRAGNRNTQQVESFNRPGAVDHAPNAVADSYVTNAGTPLVVTAGRGVLTNDTDADHDPLTAILDSGPAHGALHLQADGSFDYTPDGGFHGSDSFRYRASDGQADSAEVTVTITVQPVHEVPTGVGGTVPVQVQGRGPFYLLPVTPYFNRLRARYAHRPDQFVDHRPRLGAFIRLETLGPQAPPSALLPRTPLFQHRHQVWKQDPVRFDRQHPILGGIMVLETTGLLNPPARLLPQTPHFNAVRLLRSEGPDQFALRHSRVGVLLKIENWPPQGDSRSRS